MVSPTSNCLLQQTCNFESRKLWKIEKLDVSISVVRGLLNLHKLWIISCQSMEEVITKEEQQGKEIMCNEPLFPRLEDLYLKDLPKLGHFILTKHAIVFPFLKEVDIRDCPEMKTFVQQGSVSTPSLEIVNDDDELKVVDLNKAMFNSKISCPGLEKLFINGAHSITALCSHQLPTAYFRKLEKLEVDSCEKLRNLMSPLVARGVLNLRVLGIKHCQSMEQVITEEEQQGEEIMNNELLFPLLEELELQNLPKLWHFFLTMRALEFPFLKKVKIDGCLERKTFVQQGAVSLESVNINDEVEVVDLNKEKQKMFNSKVSSPSLEVLYIITSNSITSPYSHQLPCYFGKLVALTVSKCGNWRNLMSPSVARGVLKLREVKIKNCPLMEEVITAEEEEGEDEMSNESLFPLLEKLCLYELSKLGHFFRTKRALEFPFLGEVEIGKCPEMKTFVQ
ncbi:hypothetical protein BC332_26918 [Capsicum chinense]|nr:hypothetical protein BC332_26918 [Capsicum chinense]